MSEENTKIASATGDKVKKVTFSMGWRIVLMAVVPMVLLAIALTVYSTQILREGMQVEAMSGIKYVSNAIHGAYDHYADGNYALNDEGELVKGELNLSERIDILDAFVAGTDVQATLFYGDVRKVTTLVDADTGERMIGTTASKDVVKKVIEDGKNYESYDMTINGEHYYVHYEPMKNPDGKIVGMVFVGLPVADINEYILEETLKVVAVAVFFTIFACVVVALLGARITKALRKTETTISAIAAGDLTVEIDEKIEKRSDEIGVIAYSVRLLVAHLKEIVSNIQKSAGDVNNYGSQLEETAAQTSATSDDISAAVEDISKGAVSQAEDIEEATFAVTDMGKGIEDIVAKVENLSKTAEHMKTAGDAAADIMVELSASNDRTTDAIDRVAENIKQTDHSVQQIQSAVAVITSIASETSLLSLNASIEAARAGEAGRGFAVVASEIQKLAEESNQSAQRIEEIIQNLLEDSGRTMQVMEEVNVIVDHQQRKLDETKKKFDNVSRGIISSREDIIQVSKAAKDCDSYRVKVVDIIQNLSAISQENAAATEETTASMQELNATINLLAQSAEELMKMADALDKETQYFKTK